MPIEKQPFSDGHEPKESTCNKAVHSEEVHIRKNPGELILYTDAEKPKAVLSFALGKIA